VAREIKAAVTPEEMTRLAWTPQANPEAYEAYLKGQFHWYRISAGHYGPGAQLLLCSSGERPQLCTRARRRR